MQARLYFTALLAALAFCGTAQAQPHLTLHTARTAVAKDAEHAAIIDGGTSGTATDCRRLTRTAVECWGHEYGIQTYWVEGPADLAYRVTVRFAHGKLTFDSMFA